VNTQTVYDEADGHDPVASGDITTPTKAGNAQYSYTYNGWDATNWTNVTEDRVFNVVYTQTVNKYTATFVRSSEDGGGTLYTQSNVPYGTTPTYSGSTPTTTQGDYAFLRWEPTLAGITGNTTYIAVFETPIAEIADDWETICANIDNGTAAYKLGNYKPIDLGTEGIINFQIVAENADEKASGGNAKYSFSLNIKIEFPLSYFCSVSESAGAATCPHRQRPIR